MLTNSKYNAHTDPLFKELKLLKVTDIVKLKQYKFCNKLEKKLLPYYFQDNLFLKVGSIQGRNLRNRNHYRTLKIKHEFARNCISYIILFACNECPRCIVEKIETHSYAGFGNYIRSYFVGNYDPTCHLINCYICNG